MRMHMLQKILLIFVVMCLPCKGEASSAIIADVSDRSIAVTAGFTGARTTLFGTLPESGDVIIVVKGPPETITVREKNRIAGMWVNGAFHTFKNVPGIYWVASSRPLELIAPDDFLRAQQIGLMNISLKDSDAPEDARIKEFSHALLIQKAMRDEYTFAPAMIHVMEERLYRADLELPSSAPTGAYIATTYLMQDGKLISAQQTPIYLKKVGTPEWISNMAQSHSYIYALITIVFASFSGWFSALLLQRR